MNKETEASIKLIEQLANASALLKKNIDIYSKEAQESSLEFKRIVDDYQTYTKKVTEEANNSLSNVMRQSITSSVEASADDIAEGIRKSTNILLNTMEKFQQTQKNLVGQTKWLSWKALIVLLMGLITLVGITFKLSGDEYRRYQYLKLENEGLEKSINRKHIILKTDITVCGDSPCIKLDTKSNRWGSNGEYILIDAQ